MILIRRFLTGAAMLAAVAHPAVAADWKMDAGTSRLEFSATFEKTNAPGTFKVFDARAHLDGDKPSEGRLDVTIDITSADMNGVEVNKAIGGSEWFDFAHYPRAEFHAADIRRTDGDRYLARGTLSLKGVSQQVEVPFAWTATADSARMNGEFVVKRSAFGIGTGEWAATKVIGADVTIRFVVQLRKVV